MREAVTGLLRRALTRFFCHALADGTGSDICIALNAFNAFISGWKGFWCAALCQLREWWWVAPCARGGRASRARHETRTARASWKTSPRGTTPWWARTGWWIYPPRPHLWVKPDSLSYFFQSFSSFLVQMIRYKWKYLAKCFKCSFCCVNSFLHHQHVDKFAMYRCWISVCCAFD